MVRNNFDASLRDLKLDVIKMMDIVDELLNKSIQALVSQDTNLAREAIMLDDSVDKLMYDIEKKAINLIALQQPMAKDLRVLFSISKIITDVERVGDYCVNVAKECILIDDEKLIKPLVDIPKMKNIISNMLKSAKDSFILEDANLAFKVGEEDELVDNLYADIYKDILKLIHDDEKNINQGTKLLFVGRYLERMGDHITNICERIIYICKGEVVEIN